MASAAKNSTPWTGRSRSTLGSKDRPGLQRPLARGSPPPWFWRHPPFWRYPMTTRRTALCSSERIFASFSGSRLTPERSSKSSDLGARIHSVPRSSRRHGARAGEFKLEFQFGERGRHAGAGGANAQIFKPLDQFSDRPTAGLFPREASHDGFPQVDAKGLDFNRVLPGAGRLL